MVTTSDFDGTYTLSKVPVGNQTVVFSFLGYKSVQKESIIIKAGQTVTNLNQALSAAEEGVALDKDSNHLEQLD